MPEVARAIRETLDDLRANSLPTRARAAQSGYSPLTVQRDGVAIVVGVGYDDRLPVTIACLKQILREASDPSHPYSISSIVLVNFGVSSEGMRHLENLLDRAKRKGLICNYIITTANKHSAALSFNVGVKALASEDHIPAFVVKVDDDSRFAQHAFSRLLYGAQTNQLDLIAPVTIRPQTGSDFYRRAFFKELQKGNILPGDILAAPKLRLPDGSFNLAGLMIGYNTGASTAAPQTPNENGLAFSHALIDDLLKTRHRQVFSESPGGSEGLRLFAALSASSYATSIGVMRVPVFDRASGDPKQPLSWGRTDAELVEALIDANVLPPGISACFYDQTNLGSLFISYERPIVIKCLNHLRVVAKALEKSDYNRLFADLSPDLAHIIQPALQEMRRQLGLILDHTANANESARTEIFATLQSSDPGFHGFESDFGRIRGSALHLAGSFIYSRDHGIPWSVFTTW